MAVFRLDRFNNGAWHSVAAHTEPFSLSSIQGPRGEFPSNPHRPAFTGSPGGKARIVLSDGDVEHELESYSWERILSNPSDPESNMIWNWKLIERKPFHASYRPASFMTVGP